jgi:hypothetical protein
VAAFSMDAFIDDVPISRPNKYISRVHKVIEIQMYIIAEMINCTFMKIKCIITPIEGGVRF